MHNCTCNILPRNIYIINSAYIITTTTLYEYRPTRYVKGDPRPQYTKILEDLQKSDDQIVTVYGRKRNKAQKSQEKDGQSMKNPYFKKKNGKDLIKVTQPRILLNIAADATVNPALPDQSQT